MSRSFETPVWWSSNTHEHDLSLDRFTGKFARGLERALEEFLGPGIGVRVEAVARIEVEPSGKRLVIKSALTSP